MHQDVECNKKYGMNVFYSYIKVNRHIQIISDEVLDDRVIHYDM